MGSASLTTAVSPRVGRQINAIQESVQTDTQFDRSGVDMGATTPIERLSGRSNHDLALHETLNRWPIPYATWTAG